MSTDTKMDQKNPGESNPAEVFVVVNQRPMWLPRVAMLSFAGFQAAVAPQLGTAVAPQNSEQAHFVKHASTKGITMGA